MHRIAIIAAALLAGCASSEAIRTADGGEEHLINCPGLASSWDACYAKAEEKCGPKGYRLSTA